MAKLGDFEAFRLVVKLSLHALELTDMVFEVTCHPGATPPMVSPHLGDPGRAAIAYGALMGTS